MGAPLTTQPQQPPPMPDLRERAQLAQAVATLAEQALQLYQLATGLAFACQALPAEAPHADEQALWGPEQTSAFLGVPVASLYSWRRRGYGPASRKIGRNLRYQPGEVRAWFAQQRTAIEPA